MKVIIHCVWKNVVWYIAGCTSKQVTRISTLFCMMFVSEFTSLHCLFFFGILSTYEYPWQNVFSIHSMLRNSFHSPPYSEKLNFFDFKFLMLSLDAVWSCTLILHSLGSSSFRGFRRKKHTFVWCRFAVSDLTLIIGLGGTWTLPQTIAAGPFGVCWHRDLSMHPIGFATVLWYAWILDRLWP